MRFAQFMGLTTVSTISQYMTPDPCGIDEDLSVADAADRMLANGIRHLVVLRGDKLVGMVDTADLALASVITGRPSSEILVSQAARGTFRCAPDDTLLSVARTMENEHFGCAIIVDASGEVVGIFTVTDALRALRSQLQGREEQPPLVPIPGPERREPEPWRYKISSPHSSPSRIGILTAGLFIAA